MAASQAITAIFSNEKLEKDFRSILAASSNLLKTEIMLLDFLSFHKF
jgi:hypothetical protein